MIIDDKKVKFSAGSGFYTAVKARVYALLNEKNTAATGDWRLFLKTGLILAYFVAAYSLLVFVATPFWFTGLNIIALAWGVLSDRLQYHARWRPWRLFEE